MAEQTLIPPRGRWALARDGFRAYGLIAMMWVRSTMAYRASFALTTIGHFAGTGLDFVAVLLMFGHVEQLGGFSLGEVAFLYGVAGAALGIGDLLMGTMGKVGQRVRDGTLDTLLVRPVPVLAQLAADQFALRRIGRITQGLAVMAYAIWQLDQVQWTPLKVVMVPMMLLSGGAIFAALFTMGGAFQFLAQDAAEVQSAFTFGGNALLQYPPTVFAKDLVRGVTFLLPLAFVNWIPAMYVLGRPYPLDVPGWFAFAPPLVAVVFWAVAGLLWRAGLRSYRSTGS
ncbi:ABC transporter permease [Streptomyces sp. NPDC087440]|uniref:ABC transporter permease n=1 Tax=Streptomyces sp. NPDC087440 TaxID=3365790 RepID=UPI0038260847